MQDAIIQGKERAWMKGDTGTMPRQKLMRATLDALVDIAKAQDSAVIGVSRQIDGINRRLDELDARYREILREVDTTNHMLAALLSPKPADPLSEIPEDGGGEPMLEVLDPAQDPTVNSIPPLTPTTTGWEHLNWRETAGMTLTDEIMAGRHPSVGYDEKLLANWQTMLLARKKLWRVAHQLGLDSSKRGFNGRMARLISDTKVYRRSGVKQSDNAVSSVRHAALVWTYAPDESGMAVPHPKFMYSVGYLNRFIEALDELLGE